MNDDSSKPGITELFSFEKSVVLLDDGTWFHALKEATRCWTEYWPLSAYNDDTLVHALYQRRDDMFVWMEFVAHGDVNRYTESGWVLDCDDPRVAHGISAVKATEFLIRNHYEIPEILVDSISQLGFEEDKKPECRPLSHWNDKGLKVSTRSTEKPWRVIDLLEDIKEVGVAAVQELRGEPYESNYRQTSQLAQKLTERYRIDPSHWWGTRKSVPPENLEILKLQWPEGVADLQTKVIPRLRELVVAPVAAIYCSSFSISHLDRANHIEVEAARRHLSMSCSEIDTLVATLAHTLQELKSGNVYQKIPETWRQKGVKKPNETELAIYLLKTVLKMTNPGIRKTLKLKYTDGHISRKADVARRWFGAGNPMPSSLDDIKNFCGKAIPFDPAILELGARRDGITPRQRDKKLD